MDLLRKSVGLFSVHPVVFYWLTRVVLDVLVALCIM